MSDGRLLYVFDFDWSLVEENSDTWVLDKLGATAIFRRLKATGSSLSGGVRLCRPFMDAGVQGVVPQAWIGLS